MIGRARARGHLRACLLLLGCAAFPAQATENPLRLPGEPFLDVWQLAGPPKVYIGAQLYDYIDGGAETFYELGFGRVTVQRYRTDADEIVVELYAMRDPVAALGIYLAKCGQEKPAPGFTDRHTAGRHQLMLVRDRYFLVVDNLSGKVDRASALVDCAHEIVKSLPETAPPAVFAALPKTGLVDGSERVIRGPLALQSFILLGEGDILRLGGEITAVLARYTGGALGPRTLIVVPYPDGETATRSLAYIATHLDSEIKPLAQREGRLVFADYGGTYGVVAVEGATLTLTLGLARQPIP